MTPAHDLLLHILDKPLLCDVLFGHFSAAEIIRMGKTCVAAWKSVNSYSSRAWSIHRNLRRFVKDPLEFRSLQARTGTVISGSVALQFIDRTFYPEADLDIYVYPRYCEEVGLWFLKEAGMEYVFEPNSVQKSDFEAARSALPPVPTPRSAPRDNDAMNVEDLGGTYLMSGVHAVFTFVSSLECQGRFPAKVQMIVVDNSPLECILNFHSTVVMNVITHKAAYCLFAWTTLEERRGVVVEDRRTRHEAALVKYASRGFHIVSDKGVKADAPFRSSLRFGDRWANDSLSWVIPFTMDGILSWVFSLSSPAIPFDPFSMNSWTHIRRPNGCPRMAHYVLRADIFHFSYTVQPKFLTYMNPLMVMIGESEYQKRKKFPDPDFWTWYDYILEMHRDNFLRDPSATKNIESIISNRS